MLFEKKRQIYFVEQGTEGIIDLYDLSVYVLMIKKTHYVRVDVF